MGSPESIELVKRHSSFQAVCQFLESKDSTSQTLFLWGPCSSGKSVIVSGACRRRGYTIATIRADWDDDLSKCFADFCAFEQLQRSPKPLYRHLRKSSDPAKLCLVIDTNLLEQPVTEWFRLLHRLLTRLDSVKRPLKCLFMGTKSPPQSYTTFFPSCNRHIVEHTSYSSELVQDMVRKRLGDSYRVATIRAMVDMYLPNVGKLFQFVRFTTRGLDPSIRPSWAMDHSAFHCVDDIRNSHLPLFMFRLSYLYRNSSALHRTDLHAATKLLSLPVWYQGCACRCVASRDWLSEWDVFQTAMYRGKLPKDFFLSSCLCRCVLDLHRAPEIVDEFVRSKPVSFSEFSSSRHWLLPISEMIDLRDVHVH